MSPTFAGKCIGGPWDGQQLAHRRESYWFHERSPISIRDCDRSDLSKTPEIAETLRGRYEWDYGVEAWRYEDALS